MTLCFDVLCISIIFMNMLSLYVWVCVCGVCGCGCGCGCVGVGLHDPMEYYGIVLVLHWVFLPGGHQHWNRTGRRRQLRS